MDVFALRTLGSFLYNDRKWAEAEILLQRAGRIEADGITWSMLWVVQYTRGKLPEAKATLDTALRRFPRNVQVYTGSIVFAAAQQKWDEADSLAIAGMERFSDNRSAQGTLAGMRASIAIAQGRIRDALSFRLESRRLNPNDSPATALNNMLDEASFSLHLRNDIPRAKRELAAALATLPREWPSRPDRPATTVVALCALLQDFACADAGLRYMEQRGTTSPSVMDAARGRLLLAKGDAAAAIPVLQHMVATSACNDCGNDLLARAFLAAGKPDSALVHFERYLNATEPSQYQQALYRVNDLIAVAQLHESAGDTAKAIARYSEVWTLWKKADPELQPRLEQVRTKLLALRGKG
ncbi:MAG: hypothetical protein ABIS27_02795, partial [Longimicrobiales bacterium]